MDGPGVNKTQECLYTCRTIFYCQTVAGDYDEWQFCRDNNKFELFNGEALASMDDLINRNWYVYGNQKSVDVRTIDFYPNPNIQSIF